jgi:NAD(P)-dependent dehydrogenase (short-subunit alcohol dehydrogenase family)
MSGRLAGKVAIITGGARGIGGATAIAFAADGARVVIADIRESDALATLNEITVRGGSASFVETDVTDEASCEQMAAHAMDAYGRIDTLVTCAGILQGAFVDLADFPLETFERVMAVNVRGTFLSVKHVAPHIARGGGGVVLCIASGAGVKAGSSSIAYGTSKAGVHGLVMVLDSRLAPQNIRIHAICPGSIDTPLKRENVRDGAIASGQDPDAALKAAHLASPDGVAKVLAFLGSADADYVRGSIFTR